MAKKKKAKKRVTSFTTGISIPQHPMKASEMMMKRKKKRGKK